MPSKPARVAKGHVSNLGVESFEWSHRAWAAIKNVLARDGRGINISLGIFSLRFGPGYMKQQRGCGPATLAEIRATILHYIPDAKNWKESEHE